MVRRLFNTLTVLSLLLSVLLVAVWLQGFFYAEFHTSGRVVSVTLRHGYVGVLAHRKTSAEDQWLRRGPPIEVVPGNVRAFRGTDAGVLGFAAGPAYGNTPPGQPARDWVALAPVWGLLLLTLIIPSLHAIPFARRLRQRRRHRLNLCPDCGYDLRASPGRCPECGAEASAGLDS